MDETIALLMIVLVFSLWLNMKTFSQYMEFRKFHRKILEYHEKVISLHRREMNEINYRKYWQGYRDGAQTAVKVINEVRK